MPRYELIPRSEYTLSKDWWMTVDSVEMRFYGGMEPHGMVRIKGSEEDSNRKIIVEMYAEDFENEISNAIIRLRRKNKAVIYRLKK